MAKTTQPFEIAEAPADISFDEFDENYFQPEIPVVIRGIGGKVRCTDDLTIENIREKIVDKGLVTENTSWFEGPSEMLDLLVDTPEIVSRPMGEAYLRKNHCRLWLNGAGNFTPSHYDGNMIFVYNLQLKGRKEWRIVSPHTPLTNYPFSRAALFGNGGTTPPRKKGIEFSEFVLEEGDMIFLPAFWHHCVRATAESNVNVNWVGTRKSGWVESKSLQRERELLKFALIHYKLWKRTGLLNLMLGAGIEGYVENFAGVGWDFIHEVAADVPFHRFLTRMFKEAAMAPFALKDSKRIKKQLKAKPLDSVKTKAKPEEQAA